MNYNPVLIQSEELPKWSENIASSDLEVEDWMRLKSLRLRSVIDSPEAFGTTLEAMQDRADMFWRTQIKKTWPVLLPIGTPRAKNWDVCPYAAPRPKQRMTMCGSWGCGYAPPHAGRIW